MRIDRSKLDKLITVERPVAGAGIEGAGSGSWQFVTRVWAEIEDRLPSRAERIDSGINIAARPARVRMDIRDDITADMRFVLGSRVMQIIAGPAIVNEPEAVEFMVEDYSTAGGGA